jgi:hypothetical protein
MPYPNEHAARVRDPALFQPDSFRSKELARGIRVIIGKLKGSSSMAVQAYRFAADQYTAAEAKEWLKRNGVIYISFEPAVNR